MLNTKKLPKFGHESADYKGLFYYFVSKDMGFKIFVKLKYVLSTNGFV